MSKDELQEGLSWIVNIANDWLIYHSPPGLLIKRQQLLYKNEKSIHHLIEQIPKEINHAIPE